MTQLTTVCRIFIPVISTVVGAVAHLLEQDTPMSWRRTLAFHGLQLRKRTIEIPWLKNKQTNKYGCCYIHKLS